MWANSFKHYGCSPKSLTEYLTKHRPGEYDIVWVFDSAVNPPADLPDGVRVVRYFSLDYLKEIHTAHYVVCNMRTGSAYMWHKRPDQKYIQTWHSSIRLKKIEKDAGDSLPASYIQSAMADSARTDLIVSGCEFSTNIFRNSFWYSGPIFNCGTPRCDIFFSANQAEAAKKVYDSLGISSDKRIALYAPTFRNDKSANLHGLDFNQIKCALKQKTGDDWEILFRLHPNILQAVQSTDSAIDVSRYPDMQELIAASDLLITDYSSCMFDMAIAQKPCILFTPDIETYLSSERGIYFHPDNLPFPIARDNAQLVQAILSFDENKYRQSVADFLSSVGSYEQGNASEKLVNYIENNFK